MVSVAVDVPRPQRDAAQPRELYTQAMANGAVVVRYADVPRAGGAVAMLIAHQQDIGR